MMNQGIFNTGIVSVFQKDLDEINFKMHVLEAQNKRYREALVVIHNAIDNIELNINSLKFKLYEYEIEDKQ